MQFRNRGHFCNYCRKVVASKCEKGTGYSSSTLNPVLWHVWENEPERIEELLLLIKSFETKPKEKVFNKQIKALYSMFTVSPNQK